MASSGRKERKWSDPFIAYNGEFKPFMVWNAAAGVLHLGNALATFIVDQEFGDVDYPMYQGFSDWSNKTTFCSAEGVGTYENVFEFTNDDDITLVVDPTHVGKRYALSLGWLIFSFHLLSGVFQLGIGCCFGRSYSRSVMEDGVNIWRFVEYSISASIMLICLLLIQYVQDIYAQIGVGVLTAATMLFGLVAEWLFSDSFISKKQAEGTSTATSTIAPAGDSLQLIGVANFVDEVGIRKRSFWSNDFGDGVFRTSEEKVKVDNVETYIKVRKIGWCAHLSGWLTIIGAYGGVLFNHFYWSVENSDRKAPDFVEPLLWGICALYNIFGFTQLYQMCLKDPWCSSCRNKKSESSGFLCTSRVLTRKTKKGNVEVEEKIGITDDGSKIKCKCCKSEISLNEGIELFYVLNSLTTKTVLGWVIISQLIVQEGVQINQIVECE